MIISILTHLMCPYRILDLTPLRSLLQVIPACSLSSFLTKEFQEGVINPQLKASPMIYLKMGAFLPVLPVQSKCTIHISDSSDSP